MIISVHFGVEENLSVGPRVLCKKCYRRIEKYEATLKELTTLKDRFSKHLLWWKGEGSEALTGLNSFRWHSIISI